MITTKPTDGTPEAIRFAEYISTTPHQKVFVRRRITGASRYDTLKDVEWTNRNLKEPSELFTNSATSKEETADSELVKTFAEYIEQQLLMTRHLLYQFKFVPGGERALKECLRKNQKIHTTSDGSLNKERQHSSFGWLLIANKCVLVEGAGPVDGVPDLLSSTRAKLFGFGAVIEFLYHFCVFYNIQDCTSTLVNAH